MTMRVLIIADDFFCSRERSLLSRLEVGLVDEGVRVVQAIPLDDEAAGRFASSAADVELHRSLVHYSARTVAITRAFAARQLVTEISLATGESGAPAQIDLVHVFGGASWGLGAEVAMRLDAQLLLEVWRGGLAERAVAFSHSLSGSMTPPVLVAPDPAIERHIHACAARLDAQKRAVVVKPASWGVHVPTRLRPVLMGGRAVTAAIVGSGRDSHSFLTALEGVAAALAPCEDAVIFCDALAARRVGAYGLASRQGFLPRLTLIDELEARRDLMLHADLLIHPDSLGEYRSVLLEAMASGMIVIAAADPMLSILMDGSTACVVNGRESRGWRSAVESVLADGEAARRLASSAHQFVRSARTASAHVRQVLGIYQWMESTESIPIAAGQTKS